MAKTDKKPAAKPATKPATKAVKAATKPVAKPANIIELLAEWRNEPAPGPQDQFPDIEDMPAKPEDVF